MPMTSTPTSPVTWEEGHIAQLLRILHICAVQCTCGEVKSTNPRNATKDRVGHIHKLEKVMWGDHFFFWTGDQWSPTFFFGRVNKPFLGVRNNSWCETNTVDFDVITPVFYDELRWFMNNLSYLPPRIAWLPSSCFSSTKLLLLSRSKFLSKPCAKPRHWVGGREVDGNCIQGTACCNVF